jgi:flagellar hook protein FlgE
MDGIGNNVANAATPGFKTAVVVFTDILNQTLSSGAAPNGNRGGINPMQMGLGATVGSITPVFLQGSLQTTNRNTDLAIQGDGFFMVANGDSLFFTRAGAFRDGKRPPTRNVSADENRKRRLPSRARLR